MRTLGVSENVPRILEAVQAGDAKAADRLIAAVYEELCRLASQRLAHEAPSLTLQATALVHEAYVRLVGEKADWKNREHFFAAAAEAMRRILIERVRRVGRLKYGGGRPADRARQG